MHNFLTSQSMTNGQRANNSELSEYQKARCQSVPEPVRNLGAEGRIREMEVSVRKRTVMLLFIMTVMLSISVSVSSRTQSDTHATYTTAEQVCFYHFVWSEWWVAVRFGLLAFSNG